MNSLIYYTGCLLSVEGNIRYWSLVLHLPLVSIYCSSEDGVEYHPDPDISSSFAKCCIYLDQHFHTLPLFHPTFPNGVYEVQTKWEVNVVLHFAFQTYHPGLRNVAPIWIHISTWCTFFILHLQMVAPTCSIWSHAGTSTELGDKSLTRCVI